MKADDEQTLLYIAMTRIRQRVCKSEEFNLLSQKNQLSSPHLKKYTLTQKNKTPDNTGMPTGRIIS